MQTDGDEILMGISIIYSIMGIIFTVMHGISSILNKLYSIFLNKFINILQ